MRRHGLEPAGPAATALLLAGVAAAAAGLTGLMAWLTAADIAAVRAARQRAAIEAALPALRGRDWWASSTVTELADGARLLSIPAPDGGRYRVLAPWPVAGGYNGRIDLLVALDSAQRVQHVAVLHHRETPGLGDRIERRHGDWLAGFDGLGAADLPASQWQLRVDGGRFDAVTGATVTSRAVLRGVHAALLEAAALERGGEAR